MQLTELFDIAFARGTGKSLADMEASGRFGELLAQLTAAPDPRLAATTQLLGETLIDTAIPLLPGYILDLADDWPNRPAESQLLILELLYQELRKEHREDKDNKRYRHDERQPVARFLPAEFGPWPGGPVKPACIGMGTLLMAFAKRCGAPHWFAQVPFTHHKAIMELDLKFLIGIRDELHERLPTMAAAGELAPLDRQIDVITGNLANVEAYTFHPSLVIQLSDGRWVLVDPYLDVRVVLDPEEWVVDRAAETLRSGKFGQVVTVGSRAPLLKLAKKLETEWASLTRVLNAVKQHGPKTHNHDRAFYCAMVVHLCREKLPWTAELLEGRNENWIATDGLFPAFRKNKQPSRREILRLIGRLDHDPQYARLVSERILSLLYRLWLQRVWTDMQALERSIPHLSLELTDPANGVAAGVMNNLRCFLRPLPIKVDGQLVLLTDSQSVWHDTMAEVQGRKRLPARVLQCLRDREEALRKFPAHFLHPYVARILAASDPGREVTDGREVQEDTPQRAAGAA